MTKDEALKLALEALELVNLEFVCGNAHHKKKDRHKWDENCPITDRWQKAITAIKEALAQPEQIMQDSTCSTTLRLQGKPYPRTCKKCGLGPCIAQPTAQPKQEPVALEEYDAGLLNDFGGGKVEWWQDYIRAELGRAYEYYQSQMVSPPKRKPLTDEEIEDIWKQAISQDNGRNAHLSNQPFVHIARAIEAAHGIFKE